MAETTSPAVILTKKDEPGFVRAIGLFDGTMIVVGSMIGSGIFIVAADISRVTGSPGGLLLTWIITGLLTISAALAYGELAALFPHAGGQYVYLREAYSPLWGFLYGWTLFLVIQTGTIAAVAVGFARYVGVLFPSISPTTWIIHPISLGSKLAISLSIQQIVAILMIVLITFLNTLGVRLGKLIQNIFTSAKTLSLLGLILIGLFVGRNHAAIADNFSNFWTVRGAVPIEPGASLFRSWFPTLTAASGFFGLVVAFGVSQVGSLFSADAWNNIGFTAAEVKNPKRDVALSMALGTIIVITLYCLANLAYLFALPAGADSKRTGRSCRNSRFERHLRASRRIADGRSNYYFHLWLQQRADSSWLARGLRDGQGRTFLSRHWKIERERRARSSAGVPVCLDRGADLVADAARGRRRSRDLRQSLQQFAGLCCLRSAHVLRADHPQRICTSQKAPRRGSSIQGVRISVSTCAVHYRGLGNFVYSIVLQNRDSGLESGDRIVRTTSLLAVVAAKC